VAKLHDQPVVREFALKLDDDLDVARVVDRCQDAGVHPGLALDGNVLLVALTEQRSRADIDRLAEVLGAAVAAERAESLHASGTEVRA
jgi:glycine dehydrogenase subunit 1